MIPYFFAAGHVNYARYGLCHLLSMSRLPSSILDQYLKGEHVLRHREGIWNGNWSDMMIETSYMNLAKVRMELLEKQQSQDRCKSGPKVNTRAVKYSNLWIPSERFMKLEWQPIKKKRMEGWKQILQTKWSSKTSLKHGSILSIVQTTHRVPFATFILVNCQVLTNRSRLVQNKWLHSRDHYQIVFDQR